MIDIAFSFDYGVVMKPQVLLRYQDNYGVHFIKKWHDNGLTMEGHTPEKATSHNANVPCYFFPIDDDYCSQEFSKQGKVYAKNR